MVGLSLGPVTTVVDVVVEVSVPVHGTVVVDSGVLTTIIGVVTVLPRELVVVSLLLVVYV